MSPITRTFAPLLARLQERLPEPKVGLAPADAFFIRTVEVPAGLPADERAGFIQLALEGNSPFPMEQLAWGFLDDPASPHALVYATPKSRLKRLGIEHPERFHQLFPGFVTVHGDPVEAPAVRFVCEAGVLSALFLSPAHPVPSKVVSRRVADEPADDTAILAARDQLAATLALDGHACEDGVRVGAGSRILSDGSVRFLHRRAGDDATASRVLPLSGRALWAADLRDDAYAGRESTIRRRSRLIWTSLRAAGWAIALLLALQLFTLGLSGFNALRERKIRQLEPQAVRVENKLTLAQRLTQSTEEDLQPFLLMEAVNTLRPDSIFYEKVRSRTHNELEIEGLSSEGVTPVNAFADSIGQLAFVKSVKNTSQTRNNQTSFEFIISFSSLPPAPEGGFVVPAEETAAVSE